MNLRNQELIRCKPVDRFSDGQGYIFVYNIEGSNSEKDHFDSHKGFSAIIGDEEVTLNTHTSSEYEIPKPLYIRLSTLVMQLSANFKNEVHKLYDFYLQDVSVEFEKDCREKSYYYDMSHHYYKYFADYVLVGIPTQRYNWFLEQVQQLTSLKIHQNSITETYAYTWVIAESDMFVECCTYSEKEKQLVSVGFLNNSIHSLNSNVVGTGHFRISVAKSYLDQKYFLIFKLNKFQLKNKTRKSSIMITEAIDKVEPPEDLMAELNIAN